MNIIDYISDEEKYYFDLLDNKKKESIISSSELYVLETKWQIRCFWETRGWDIYLGKELKESIDINKNRLDKLKTILDDGSI